VRVVTLLTCAPHSYVCAGTQCEVYVNLALGRDFTELVRMDVVHVSVLRLVLAPDFAHGTASGKTLP
jgi:hypothetical protein